VSSGHRNHEPSACQHFFPKCLDHGGSHILSADEHLFAHNHFGLDLGVLATKNNALVLL